MLRAFAIVGNPSSVHSDGRAARASIELARTQVAQLVRAAPKNVFFAGSGTEAANLVLTPSMRRAKDKSSSTRLLVSAVEHACSLAGGQFESDTVTVLPVDDRGRLDLAALECAMNQVTERGERVLLSLQLANNETGVIQPVAEAANIVRLHDGLMHVDAVQAAGKMPVSISDLGADVLTLSAHKLGGPKGVGAFIFADDSIRLGRPLIRGGGQERSQRAGTENVAGIVGFGVAAETVLARMQQMNEVRRLRDRLEMGIRVRAPDVAIFAGDILRLPNTSCFAVSGMSAETALIGFDMDGVSVSSGSACSSGKVRKSHVLAAMGVSDDLARAAIRVSLGPTTSEADLEQFLKALENRLKSLHKQDVRAA